MMDRKSIVMDPGSLEIPTQRSLTERADKSFKEIFAKTLMAWMWLVLRGKNGEKQWMSPM